MNVSHTYYKDLICDDFTIEPTPYTAYLMKQMDILLIPFRGGGKLVYSGNIEQKFIDYIIKKGYEEYCLQHKKVCLSHIKHCPRFSFKMYLTNPLFLNFTDLPIDLNPTSECLYLSNSGAGKLKTVKNVHWAGKAALIINNFLLQSERIELFFEEFRVDVKNTEHVCTVSLHDIVGKLAVCQNSKNQKKNKKSQCCMYFCNDKEISTPPYPKFLHLDMQGLREGKYTLKISNSIDKIIDDKRKAGIYTEISGTPFLFLDVILTNYDKNQTKDDVYPIVKKDGGGYEVKPQDYHINFKSRATYWDYYIVEPENHIKLYKPMIYSKNGIDKQKNEESFFYKDYHQFEGRNTMVHIFESKNKLELKEVSPYELRLEAFRKAENVAGNGSKSIIIKRLPAASINQINYRDKTGKKNPNNICSNIYVYV